MEEIKELIIPPEKREQIIRFKIILIIRAKHLCLQHI